MCSSRSVIAPQAGPPPLTWSCSRSVPVNDTLWSVAAAAPASCATGASSLFLRWRVVRRAIRRPASRSDGRAYPADRRRQIRCWKNRGVPSLRRLREWFADLHDRRRSNERPCDDRAKWHAHLPVCQAGTVRGPAAVAGWAARGCRDGGTRMSTFWIYDLQGASSIRQLTFEGHNRFPFGVPTASASHFNRIAEAMLAIWWQRADGTQSAERLTAAGANDIHTPEAWSPREDRLVCTDAARESQHALVDMFSADRAVLNQCPMCRALTFRCWRPSRRRPMDRIPVRQRWSRTHFHQCSSARFHRRDVKYRIAAGIHPLWSPDGKELLFSKVPAGRWRRYL